MRIEDLDDGRRFNNIGVALTRDEAEELRDSLKQLLADPSPVRHEHVSSADFQTELTVWLVEE